MSKKILPNQDVEKILNKSKNPPLPQVKLKLNKFVNYILIENKDTFGWYLYLNSRL